MMANKVLWHLMSVEESLSEIQSSSAGLTPEEAGARLRQYGPNELIEKKQKTPWRMLLDQFADFMILILIAAALISGFIGEASDTIAIVVIVLLNAALGFSQEYRAEKAMAALKRMAAAHAMVIRGGEQSAIPASALVPGDIVVLEAGNIIPADMRVFEAASLRVEEAALTGESIPAEKHTTAIRNETLPLGDRLNMLFKGTFVTYGRGLGLVTATGMNTELGRIATLLQQGEEGKTPLQKRLAVFGEKLAYAVLAICIVVFVAGLLRQEDPVRMFLVAVSLAVAAIPEALPAVVTISLALGARKMVRRNALVRRLPAVETLGSVTYICTDKTGTLTINRMTVEAAYCDGRTIPHDKLGELRVHKTQDRQRMSAADLLVTAATLCNDARRDSDGNYAGDPTEIALLEFAEKNDYIKKELDQAFPRQTEIPFDSLRKSMTTIHPWGKGYISFTKGATDVLLKRATAVYTCQGPEAINAAEILRSNDEMAGAGLRVLCIAMRRWDTLPAETGHESIEQDLTILGLVGMMDPPREEARESVALCKSAGIIPVMITGDHPLTARTIAKRVGILDGDDPESVISGAELDALPMEKFEKQVERIRVYARVAPEQKLKIVRALQDKGHFVAMTGDGVNDAPALKAADIGVSMGITGTDVAKEAASMILLDDNFATIVKAVREGRKIYDNIRKFIKYLLATNSGEIWTLFLAPFLGLPIPLQPIHILWINLVTDGLPALALSMEPEERNVMTRPPRHPGESVFSGGLGYHAVWAGLLMAGVVLSIQAWAIHTGDAHWQTMVFATLCLLQLGHVLAIRSEKESLFVQGIFTNKPLLLSVAATSLLQLATIYIPFLNPVFKTVPLTINELVIVLILSTAVFIAVEIEKLFKRRLNKKKDSGHGMD
ncbi:MAG: cation-translocating P-type ATPase [Acidobacteriota bacterium]